MNQTMRVRIIVYLTLRDGQQLTTKQIANGLGVRVVQMASTISDMVKTGALERHPVPGKGNLYSVAKPKPLTLTQQLNHLWKAPARLSNNRARHQ